MSEKQKFEVGPQPELDRTGEVKERVIENLGQMIEKLSQFTSAEREEMYHIGLWHTYEELVGFQEELKSEGLESLPVDVILYFGFEKGEKGKIALEIAREYYNYAKTEEGRSEAIDCLKETSGRDIDPESEDPEMRSWENRYIYEIERVKSILSEMEEMIRNFPDGERDNYIVADMLLARISLVEREHRDLLVNIFDRYQVSISNIDQKISQGIQRWRVESEEALF
jgi:hypothetical protein